MVAYSTPGAASPYLGSVGPDDAVSGVDVHVWLGLLLLPNGLVSWYGCPFVPDAGDSE